MSRNSSSVARPQAKYRSLSSPARKLVRSKHGGPRQQSVQELQKRNRELEGLLHGLTHDLRTYLHIIVLAADGLEEALTDLPLDYATRNCLSRLHRGTSSMRALLHAMLQTARHGHAEVVLEPVALNPLITSCLDDFHPDIVAADAQVTVASDLPTVVAEPILLQAVVSNLLSNALKFVASGVRPQVRITAIEKTPGRWCLQVHDNGIGISKDQQPKVFQPFTRLHEETMYPGFGLGLSTVRMIVERFGGRVGVDSTPGMGSTFWLELADASHPVSYPRSIGTDVKETEDSV